MSGERIRDKITIVLKKGMNKIVQESLLDNKVWHLNPDTNMYELTEPVSFLKRRNRTEIVFCDSITPRHQDKQMIVALVRAFGWQQRLNAGQLNLTELGQREQLDRGYMGKIIKLTTLAPDIVESILAGLQPPDLRLIDLIRSPIPVDWEEQRTKYGFTQ